MGIVVFSEQSQSDLFDIWAQIANRSRNLADAFFDKVEARCDQLADFPELGPQRRDIGEGARGLVVDRWIVVYRITGHGVLIVRIIDGARDLLHLNLSDD